MPWKRKITQIRYYRKWVKEAFPYFTVDLFLLEKYFYLNVYK